MPRPRRAAVLAVCALVAGGLAVLAVADPFGLRHARWFTAGLVLLAILLLGAAFAVAVRRGVQRVLVLVLGGIAALGWIALIGVASQLTTDNRVVAEVADGDRRLVIVRGGRSAARPVYAVVLRAGGGPFAQESTVYQGLPAAAPPVEVRFVDTDTVEVVTRAGCRYRSEVAPRTLAVDPVHRPLRVDGC